MPRRKVHTFPFFTAVSMIVGMVIGAGILGLPFVVARVGFLAGVFLIFLAVFSVSLTMFYIFELDLDAPMVHQVPGLVEVFLGPWAGRFMFLSLVIGVLGATTAYMVAVGEILHSVFGLANNLAMFLYFCFIFLVTYSGLKAVGRSQLVLNALKLLFVFVLVVVYLPSVDFSNLLGFDSSFIPVAFGVVLFACLGSNVMPEVSKILREDRRRVPLAIVVAQLVNLVVYVLFAFSFAGTFGAGVFEVATQNARGVFYLVGVLFALMSMTSAFIANTIVFKDSLLEDLFLGRNWVAAALACLPSFLIAVFVRPDFIDALSFTGVFTWSVTGVLICLATLFARKKHGLRVVPFGRLPLYSLLFFFVGFMVYHAFVVLL